MPRERDAGSGKYVETYPIERFIDALRANDGMAGTQDVAAHVGCSYDLAYRKLRDLSNTDAVGSIENRMDAHDGRFDTIESRIDRRADESKW